MDIGKNDSIRHAIFRYYESKNGIQYYVGDFHYTFNMEELVYCCSQLERDYFEYRYYE